MEQYIQRLYAFLEQREAKEEFLAAFAKEEPNTSLLDYYIDREVEPNHMIIAAFVWDETPSGNSYWSKLDEKWRKKVKVS